MDRVLQRRDTAANWSSTNPILAEGELGIITDGAKGYKIGDGLTRWNALEFPANPTSVVGELGDSEVATVNQKVITNANSNILKQIGNVFSINRVVFNINDNLSIDINYIDTVYAFGLNNTAYNIGASGESYNLPFNKCLVFNLNDSTHSVVSTDSIPENAVLLACNDRGYITNGLYKPFWDKKQQQEDNADYNSKINKLSIPNLDIQKYIGYMNNIGDIEETAIKFECLATNWINVKKGDIILYKGFGYSSGLSWVVKDTLDNYYSEEIDSTTEYTEVTVPINGTIRFSSYRSIESSRSLVLDILYKDSLEERIRNIESNVNSRREISKKLVNVGMSIWWLDGTVYTNRNNFDNGQICKGYQTHLQEQFEFDGIVKYAYSGYSLGIGNDDNASIMNVKASTWTEQNNAIWTLDTIVNDFGRNVPLGTIDDYNNNTGIATFYGSLRAFKDRVYELSENAIIICSNALVRTDRESKTNSLGLTFEDYEKAMCYAAAKEG